MNVWLFAAGGALLVMAAVDLIWTTIAVSRGRGPLTNIVGYGIWRGAVAVGRHDVLRWAGYAIIVAVPLVWVALIWAGFTLMLLSEPGSVQQASPPYGAASPTAVVAYAIGGLAGAGAGLVAGGPLWQALNNVSALVGLAVFTFAVTYLFQVVTAVTQQRSLAATIDGLGDGPVQAVGNALLEPGLGQLPALLASITAELNAISRKRLALPILQFFHAPSRAESIALNVAVLDEIVTIIEAGLGASHRTVTRPARQAVDDYLSSSRFALSAEPPPPPDLAPLRRVAGDQVLDDDAPRRTIDDHAPRRARLRALVQQEAWRWEPDVYPRG